MDRNQDRPKDRFYGRTRVLQEIVGGVLAVPQPASFSMVGSKLAGKTRLLDYLASVQGPLLGDEGHEMRPYAFQDGARVVVLKIDCDWQDAQADLLKHVAARLERQLREVEQIQLAWDQVEAQPGASRQIWQMSRQLNELGYRLVVVMDNFDTVFENQLLTPDSVDELRPLTREMALVVATEQPLHDLDRELAASPLFNVMTQLFIGLLETDAARAWLADYIERFPGMASATDELLALTGSHPFLLLRVGDILSEVQLMLAPGQTLTAEHLPLVRLRLAEYGRLLFVTFWRTIQEPPRRIDRRILLALIKQLLNANLALNQVAREHIPTLNWLINQGMVSYGDRGYNFFSPLFVEFLAIRLGGVEAGGTGRAAQEAEADSETIYAQLTKTEAALLHYFEQRSNQVISPEQLLADVWKRPDASPRRVQEAIRRLRLQLEDAVPPIGSIENERGQGYRFVPAVY